MTNRRRFLFEAASVAGGFLVASESARAKLAAGAKASAGKSPDEAARDEGLWARLRDSFQPAPGHHWFNCLAYNPAATPVHEAFVGYDNTVSRWPLAYNSQVFGKSQKDALRNRLAGLVNVSGEEIALVRNTTEALVTVICGLDLRRGDEVVISDQDYGPILNAWQQRQARD